MKRAQLRGLRCNACVVLGTVGTEDDAMLREPLRGDQTDEPLREQAAWALAALARRLVGG